MSAELDTLAEFVIQADRDGELSIEHWPPDGTPHCFWDERVDNGTTLPQLAALARQHLAEKHPQ